MAGQFLFPDISKSGMDERSFGRYLVDNGIGGGWGLVGTAHGVEYGKNHIRLAYCTPTDVHKEYMTKLDEALKYYEIVYKDRIIK